MASVGITGVGVYVPRYRVAPAAGGGRGERACAGHDQDSLTLGVEAALGCLGSPGLAPDGLCFASTTSPHGEKQASTLLAAVLGLPRHAFTADLASSVRGGTAGIQVAAAALACDIRIAAEGATLACSFVRVGLHPDFGTTHLLTWLVGTGRACELIFTGDALDAAAALRLGLVNQVVAAAEAEAAALELAARLAQGPLVALGMAKRAIYQAAEARLEDIVELEAAFQAICSATEDAREGVRAFADRRPPRFEGR